MFWHCTQDQHNYQESNIEHLRTRVFCFNMGKQNCREYIYIYIYISPVIDFSYFGPMQLKLTSWACQTITKCEMTSTFDTTEAYWSCDCLITILSKETLYIPLKWKWRGEKDPSAIHLHTIYPGLDLMLKQESIIASNQ